jgi:hypothetical protein
MFKMSKRMKIATLTGIILGTALAIACASFSTNSSSADKLNTNASKWLSKYPQLGKVQVAQLSQDKPLNLSESTSTLEGTITNSFGIRDDILEYIVKNIPENKESALRAAIKLAQNQNFIYYKLESEEALKLEDNNALLDGCLIIFLGNVNISMGIDSLMRNTPERDAHMWKIDREYFGWKVIGSGLSIADEKAACLKGNF